MDSSHPEAMLTKELRESLDKLTDFTPEQLKTMVEFVRQAGGFENARAAIEAIEDLSDAA